MALIESWVRCDLNSAVQVQYLQGNLFSADNQGNLVGVRVFENGEPASLSGTVSANVIRADDTTVPVAGSIQNGNECYVILPQAAYAVTGVVKIAIKITSSSVITTLAMIISTVYESSTDEVVDPGTIIPSIETLIAEIEAAVATIPADYSSLWATIAPAYTSLTFPVSKGQYCTNNGHMYRAKQDIATSESFTSSHWEVCNVGVELFNQIGAGNQAISELKSAIDDILVGNVPFTIVPNQYVKNTDGSFATYNGWSRSDYIYVGDLDEIVIDTTANSEYNYFYDASKNPIRYFLIKSGSNRLYLEPSAKYIAISNTSAAIAATVIKADVTKTDAEIVSIDTVQKAVTENVSSNVLKLYPQEKTSKGITLTVTEDSIRVHGTATGNAYFYDFFNVEDFVGSYTFGVTELSGSGFSAGDFLIQIPYTPNSNNISNNQTEYFASAPNAQIVALSGKTIDTTIRFWANKGRVLQAYEKSAITKVPNSALDCAEYNNGNMVYKLPDKADAVYHSELYYGISDSVLYLDGELTGGGFTLNLPSVTLTGYNTLNIEVIGGSYTGSLYLYLPTGETAFLTDLSASTQRLEYFDGTEKTLAIYATNGSEFSDFRFRLWITQGLSNKPYDATGYRLPIQEVKACTSGEYNAPSYARMDDDVLYSVFGNKYSVCKNGLLSRTDTDIIAKFALLADLHYTDNEAFYTRIYKKISDNYNVDFCLMLGDVIDAGYYHKPTLYQQQMTQFKNSIKYLGCPNFPFCGNHDDDVNEFAHHGVIDYGIVRFIYIWADYDGVSEGGKVKASELTWLEQQLSASTAKINILMCHYAVSTDTGFAYQLDADSRTAIISLADTYDVLLFLNGHEHDHNISVGTAGDMTDINLPNGKYAYCICTIDSNGGFTLVAYKSDDDTVLKTINVNLLS